MKVETTHKINIINLKTMLVGEPTKEQAKGSLMEPRRQLSSHEFSAKFSIKKVAQLMCASSEKKMILSQDLKTTNQEKLLLLQIK